MASGTVSVMPAPALVVSKRRYRAIADLLKGE
jgi:hypothetical protein